MEYRENDEKTKEMVVSEAVVFVFCGDLCNFHDGSYFLIHIQ